MATGRNFGNNSLLGSAILRRRGKIKAPRRQPVPLALEAQYVRELRGYVKALAEAVRQHLIPALPALSREADFLKPEAAKAKTDAWTDDLQRRIADIKVTLGRTYSEAEIKRIVARTGESVAQFNKRAVENQFARVLGVDIFLTEPYLANQMAAFQYKNYELIKTIEQREIGRLNTIVAQGFTAGDRWENIAAEIEQSFDVSQSDADRIARDQVNKMNSELTRLRQTELGIEEYVWSTSLDERVRDSHREKEGKTFRWDSPPSDTGHPGEDINCRCVPIPVFKSESESE